MAAIRKVGFIGIGNMGNPMAGHLVRAGYDVTIFDIRPEAMQAFVAHHGGRAAASLAEVGEGADAVITMLPDGKVVRKAVLGDGVAAVLARGALVIDMGSCDPIDTRSLDAELAPRGIGVIDAPVMGGVVFAKDATLDIMAGGDAELVERVRPVLKAMGRSVTHCGAVGAGHAMKSLANYVNACALINAIEAHGGCADPAVRRAQPSAREESDPAHSHAQVRHRHGDGLHRQGCEDRDGHCKVDRRLCAAW